jgi:hypothetical protein
MSDIASLNTVSNSLDAISKLVRVLERDGVSFDELMLPVNDKAARCSLVAHLKAGCPAFTEGAMPPAKPTASKEFAVWKTITIGGVSRDELLMKFEAGGNDVSNYAKDIMSKDAFTTAKEPIELQLARVKVRDLGFTKRPTTSAIWARIRELGHDLCPSEVGPRLRLTYEDQPNGDIFWVAMEQITDSRGGPDVFGLERRGDGRRWLDALWANPDRAWHLDGEIVFVLRK